MVSASMKRGLLAFAGVLALAVWVMQLINALTMDYKFETYTADNVNPKTIPGARAFESWNMWVVFIPLTLLTLLVMFTLTRWAIDNDSRGWMVVHVLVGILLMVACLAIIIGLAVSTRFLGGGAWQSSNWNMAADERLCCLRPAINTSPSIPNCPVLYNNCSPDISLTPSNDMHWNLAFRWFFALLIVDIVIALALVLISFWVGNVIGGGDEKQHIYSAISTPVSPPPLQQQHQVSASVPLGSGIVSFKTLKPIGTVGAGFGKMDHQH